MKYIFISLLYSVTAFGMTGRELALSYFPSELPKLFSASKEESRTILSGLKPKNQMEDKEIIYLNLYGTNYDVTLGKKDAAIVWMARQAIRDEKLFGRLNKLLSKNQKMLWKENVLDLKEEGVLFRFSEKKQPISIVVKKLP